MHLHYAKWIINYLYSVKQKRDSPDEELSDPATAEESSCHQTDAHHLMLIQLQDSPHGFYFSICFQLYIITGTERRSYKKP